MDTKRKIFLFSGQGSQTYHMARDLFDRHRVFRDELESLDAVAQSAVGVSILRVLYDERVSKNAEFKRLLYTHPAIFMIEIALCRVLRAEGIAPDVVLGTSLGEFGAMVVAGCMSPETALSCILRQAQIIEDCCTRASMLAVAAEFSTFRQFSLSDYEIAAWNTASHFVISQSQDHVHRMEEALIRERMLYFNLPVEYGFHSSMIDAAKDRMTVECERFPLRRPGLPYVSCVTGGFLYEFPVDYGWKIIRETICFSKAMSTLEASAPNIYIDVGPSGTLGGFARKNLAANSSSEVYSLLSPFGHDDRHLQKVIDTLARAN